VPDNTARSASELCQSCGLCCTGLLFPFVSIAKTDSFVFEHPDLNLKSTAVGKKNMKLGCSFLDGTRCSIYKDRPSKCQSYSCNLRRDVLNGAAGGENALQIIADLKALIEAIDPLLTELSGSPFSTVNFRDFCHDFAAEVSARLSNGGIMSDAERQFVPQAFEIIKIIDRYMVGSSRLTRFAGLMMEIE
jgi:Fe-S-cluster containining protein